MFYIRLVLRSVEEVVLYVFYGSRVRLVPRESTLLSKWYSKDENGVVFPVTQNGQGLQSDGNSLVILEVSSFTEGLSAFWALLKFYYILQFSLSPGAHMISKFSILSFTRSLTGILFVTNPYLSTY